MFFKKFKYLFFFTFLLSQDVSYLDQITEIDGLFYKKSDQNLVSANIYLNIDNKDFFLGEIFEGEKIGKWVVFYSNGRKKSEHIFKSGMMNGPYTLWYKNGLRGEYGFFKNNEKDKLIIKWDEKGNKFSSVTFKEGFYHGEVIFYIPNGQIKYKGIYHEGKCIEGIKKSFRHKGKYPSPVYEVYENNELVQLKWLDKEDRVIETTNCINNNCI